jgi:hypothetical protein
MRDLFSPFAHPTRREALTRAANGFGAVALATLLADEGRASDASGKPVRHHAAKAKSVIFLYMDGVAVEVRQARQERAVGQRVVPARREVRR